MIILLQINDTTAVSQTYNTDSNSSFYTILWLALIIITFVIYFVYWKTKKPAIKKTSITLSSKDRLVNLDDKKQVEHSKNNLEYLETITNRKDLTKTEKIKSDNNKPEDTKDKDKKKEVEIKRIGYKPNNKFLQNEPYAYPSVKFPNEDAPIKFPKNGRSNKKGYKEEEFYTFLTSYFANDFKVFNDKHIPQQNNHRPYEPDFLLVKEQDNKNIFINIEIDEPYEGLSKTPTHIVNQDIYRDLFFTNRGYTVIRFTERQVHLYPKACCLFIAKVIKSIDQSFELSKVNELIVLEKESQWDSLQAKKWAYEKYREKYLGIESFGIREDLINNVNSINSEEDLMVESLLITKTKHKTKKTPKDYLEKKHSHPRDERIQFYPNEHKYLIDNNPDTISVSELIERFFPEFDSISAASNLNKNHELYGMDVEEIISKWKQNGTEKANLGTILHADIENYYNNKVCNNNTLEYLYFQNFINKYPTMKPFRTEWRIFDEDLMIAGTIDMVYQKENGDFYMFDWKRSEKVVDNLGNIKLSDPSNPYTKFAFGELNHFTDDSYNKYLLQQNIYRHILEKKYNISISSMNLLILHPKYENYHLVQLPKIEKEIKYIFETSKLIT